MTGRPLAVDILEIAEWMRRAPRELADVKVSSGESGINLRGLPPRYDRLVDFTTSSRAEDLPQEVAQLLYELSWRSGHARIANEDESLIWQPAGDLYLVNNLALHGNQERWLSDRSAVRLRANYHRLSRNKTATALHRLEIYSLQALADLVLNEKSAFIYHLFEQAFVNRARVWLLDLDACGPSDPGELRTLDNHLLLRGKPHRLEGGCLYSSNVLTFPALESNTPSTSDRTIGEAVELFLAGQSSTAAFRLRDLDQLKQLALDCGLIESPGEFRSFVERFRRTVQDSFYGGEVLSSLVALVGSWAEDVELDRRPNQAKWILEQEFHRDLYGWLRAGGLNPEFEYNRKGKNDEDIVIRSPVDPSSFIPIEVKRLSEARKRGRSPIPQVLTKYITSGSDTGIVVVLVDSAHAARSQDLTADYVERFILSEPGFQRNSVESKPMDSTFPQLSSLHLTDQGQRVLLYHFLVLLPEGRNTRLSQSA